MCSLAALLIPRRTVALSLVAVPGHEPTTGASGHSPTVWCDGVLHVRRLTRAAALPVRQSREWQQLERQLEAETELP